MRIEIDLRIILLIVLFILTSQIQIYTIFIIFIFLHELAHILVGLCLGLKVRNIRVNLLGVSAEMYDFKAKKAYKKIITYLAGPLFNLACAIIFSKVNINENLKINIVYTNVVLFILNLLPIVPLDGGKILKEIIKKFAGGKNASIIMLGISKTLLICLTFFYAILILKIKNIAILLLLIYLWYLFIIEERKVKILKRAYELTDT